MEKSVPFEYDDVYEGRVLAGQPAPWDIGVPQPAFVGLLDAAKVRGHVLDAGCGTGEHALAVSARGYKVTGIDLAPAAISQAVQKARQRDLRADFRVGDCTQLPGFVEVFDTVLDCGLLHSLDLGARRAYAAALHRACRPGATAYVLSFSERGRDLVSSGTAGASLPPTVVARFPKVTPAELGDAFADGWVTAVIEESTYSVRFPGTDRTLPVPALLACYQRSGRVAAEERRDA